MSKNVYVVSALTDSISYCFYTERRHPNDTPSVREKITIYGGRGLPSTKSGFGERREDEQGMPMWVADGVVTPISEEKYSRLKDHPIFKRHLESGRMKVLAQDIMDNHKAVKNIVKDMAGPDSHALLTKGKLKERVRVKTPEEALNESFRL